MEIKVVIVGDEGQLKNVMFPLDDDIESVMEELFGEDYHLEYEVESFEVISSEIDDEIKYGLTENIFDGIGTIEEFNDKFDELTEMIDSLDNDQWEDIKAIISCTGESFDDALENLNSDKYIIYRNVHSQEDFAEDYVREMGSWSGTDIPYKSDLWSYLDWEKIARDLFIGGSLTYDEDTYRVVDTCGY